MKISRPGIRGRIILSLVIAGALAIVGLGPFLRSMVMPILVNNEGDRLLAAARVAAISVPDDSLERKSWVARLQKAWPGVNVFIIDARTEPGGGSNELAAESTKAGTTAERIIKANISGHLLTRIDPKDTRLTAEGIAIGWEALVKFQTESKTPSILGFVLTDVKSTDSPLWTLILIYGMMVTVLALIGGLIAASYLIIRPLAKTATAAGRLLEGQPGAAGMTDLKQIETAIDENSRIHRDDSRRIERQDWEIRRMRDDLRGAQTTLIRAEKLASVGQLAAGIAHEIGNPIGIILGMSEILRAGDCSPKEVQEFADAINKATVRVDGTIRDLLTFARPARDEGARTSIRQAIESTVKLVETHKSFRNVNVSISLEKEDAVAEIRPSQLQQVLLNLLLNAAYAMEGTGEIKVFSTIESRRISIAVQDFGPGIAEADLEKIFNPFFTTKPPGEGTGLGLAMSAQIVEIYGGEIDVKSSPGKGATFVVKLWLADSE